MGEGSCDIAEGRRRCQEGRSQRQAGIRTGSGLPGEAVGRPACERTGAQGKGFARDRRLLVTEKSRGKHSGCSQRQGSETSSGPEAGAPSGSGSRDEWGGPVSLGWGSRSFPRPDTKSPPLLGPKGELGHGRTSTVDGWMLRSWRNEQGGSAPSTEGVHRQHGGTRLLGLRQSPLLHSSQGHSLPPQPGSVRCLLRRAQPWVGRLRLSVPRPQPLSATPHSPTLPPPPPGPPTDTLSHTPTTLH